MDIAKEILDSVNAEPGQKALARHAFEVAPHEHALAGMIAHLRLPQETKADLWDAKKNAVHDPKITKMMQMANLPKDLLQKVEAHPNAMKLLMEKDKEEKQPTAAKGGKPTSEKTAESGMQENNPSLDTNAHQSELPEGHTHLRTSQGAEIFLPNEHLPAAQNLDPGLQILNQK
jgi:hypothetical protein